jgi:hypothetical protein
MDIPDGDPNLSARVEIELRDGRRLRASRDHARYAGPLACSSLPCAIGVK